jgi:hypothetical protein
VANTVILSGSIMGRPQNISKGKLLALEFKLLASGEVIGCYALSDAAFRMCADVCRAGASVLGIREMETIGFLKRADVIDGCILRMPKAYPAYIGSFEQLSVVREYVQKIPNLFLIGRNGMHRYNNQDHSMLTAMMAVDNIVEGRADSSNLWDVNLEMVYHETKGAPSS